MIDRIRERFFAGRGIKRAEKQYHTALRGSAHNIIVVKAPNDIFTEAIFILRDDYYSEPSASSAELLRQAKEAAKGYSSSVSVKERWKTTAIIVLAVLLSAETAGIFLLI